MKFAVDKKPLEKMLTLVGFSLGDQNNPKEKHLKFSLSTEGLLIKASSALTFAKGVVPLDFEDEPAEEVVFCVEGSRFLSAIKVLDENERVHFTYDKENSQLAITNGKFKGAIPVKEDVETHFLDFESLLESQGETEEFPVRDFVKALSFLKKFPQSSGDGNESSTLIELKEEAFVGGDAARIGFFFSTNFTGNMKISNEVLSTFLSVLRNVESDIFKYSTVKDDYAYIDAGNVQFGFKQWGTVPAGVLKRLKAFQATHSVKGDKTWLQSIIKKMVPYLAADADIITIGLTGTGNKGLLTVAMVNETGETCQESYNVFRELGDEDYTFKINYKKLLEVLDSLDGNTLELEVDKSQVIKIGEENDGVTAVSLLSPVR